MHYIPSPLNLVICLCEKQTEMKGFYSQNYHMALEDLVYSESYGLLLYCFYYAFACFLKLECFSLHSQ